jgi:hypothetical protein
MLIALCSYHDDVDDNQEHVLWPELSHLLHNSVKWNKNRKRKSGADGALLLLLLQ